MYYILYLAAYLSMNFFVTEILLTCRQVYIIFGITDNSAVTGFSLKSKFLKHFLFEFEKLTL